MDEPMSDILYDAATQTEVITVSKALWDTTQERVKNAINALWDIALGEVDGPEAARDALDRDVEFEIELGM